VKKIFIAFLIVAACTSTAIASNKSAVKAWENIKSYDTFVCSSDGSGSGQFVIKLANTDKYSIIEDMRPALVIVRGRKIIGVHFMDGLNINVNFNGNIMEGFKNALTIKPDGEAIYYNKYQASAVYQCKEK